MPATLPNRTVIWNEQIHTFEPIGFNRFSHYARPVWSHQTKDDRPAEPRFMSGTDVDKWIKDRSPEPFTEETVKKSVDEWESGNYGPPDNPRKDTGPKPLDESDPKHPW